MPPRAKSGPVAETAKASNSWDLISTGPKGVQNHHGKHDERQREVRPTTERALVLRNGKYGSQGTGEMILMTKMMGREKLDLLAEDLVEKASKSLLTPFRLELCIKLAESQLSENLDDIANLKDSDLFFSIIEEEIKSRNASDTKQKNGIDPMNNSSYIAQIISDRIHNAYLLGSAWKIVVDLLYVLQEGGLSDESVIPTLKRDNALRSQYLLLYDLVIILVDLNQTKFSVLATTTPHYACYFKETTSGTGEKGFFFDWSETRKACSSFLDSIIVELCFPRAPYPKTVLYGILHDAIAECPRDAKRFPQMLWDSVGDLSVSVQLQQILETPLLSPNGKVWKAEVRQKYGPYEKWVAAQLYSQIASDGWTNFKEMVFPLHFTKAKDVLNIVWKTINGNYNAICGEDIDALWGLTEVLSPTPHWHSYRLVRRGGDDDDDGPPKSSDKTRKPLAITYSEGSDDSMPFLEEVSDSDTDSDNDWSDNAEHEDDGDSSDDENGYDTDQEITVGDMLREAMDVVTAVNWQEPPDKNDERDPFAAEDRKGNPFLKLLGSLRGRMFTKSSKLKTAIASENPLTIKPATSGSASADRSKGGLIIEEVSEEEDDIPHVKKKKKKRPKKKKKQPSAFDGDGDVPVISEVVTPPPPSLSPAASPAPAAKAQTKAPSSLVKSKVAVHASPSTTSLYPLETVTTAQSARSYLQSEQLDAPRTKVKSRSAQASLFPSTKGLFNKFGVGKEKKKDTLVDKKERRAWFANLGKKTRTYLHQILNTADDETKGTTGMKWDTFVKALTDLGFTYVPSTAGSSVRFDPPDSRDRSISFHKPHPDSTIGPVLLKKFSKKLRTYYGWDPIDLMD
ncbi:hypothetical protein J3R30DRAFT_3697951 [Lentinula aciculospora]|uniref:Uncharacterized protein n=1 Tax=Lentinula aciculospora TaxID=153920 RepID=A0A9W9AHW5_9AGAR|nr:hypothetical protein J3R30DRAFT_3697951 [Lentinula aciculospora]